MRTTQIDPNRVREKCELKFDYEESMYYVVEKVKLEDALRYNYPTMPRGIPIPSARVKDWTQYIAQYDPFGWVTDRAAPAVYARKKQNIERQRARIKRQKKEYEKAKETKI